MGLAAHLVNIFSVPVHRSLSGRSLIKGDGFLLDCIQIWLQGWDLNPHAPPYEGGKLPVLYPAIILYLHCPLGMHRSYGLVSRTNIKKSSAVITIGQSGLICSLF